MRPALFFDRDGTLIKEKEYLKDPALVELESGAATALRAFENAGYGRVIVTNQSGIGRGLLTLEDFNNVNSRMSQLLAVEQASVDGVYFCPHAPEAGCACRKPKPELVFSAARDLGLDLTLSFFIGDKPEDVETALNSGVTPVLVLTGYGRASHAVVPPDVPRVDSLLTAAAFILKQF